MPLSRWQLRLKATMWRKLMSIGMHLHAIAPPAAPKPSKVVKIPSTLSKQKGHIPLLFYFPQGHAQRPPTDSYPVMFVFHGGGFTIGTASDDARWARAINAYADAVCICVDYRLAPEYPFPTPIEDGVDAVLYVLDRAEEFKIDPHRISFSGFSAGGNMCFSVPIRLSEEYRIRRLEEQKPLEGGPGPKSVVQGTVVAISAWYPSLDFTRSRAERRKSISRADKSMPAFFTDLFDASYLYPNEQVDLHSPWLSPGVAPDLMIRDLPKNIIIYSCEWDELLAETERFYERLTKDFPEKRVVYKKVLGVEHAFDKTTNPIFWDPKIEGMYKDVCEELKTVYYGATEPAGGVKEDGKKESIALPEEPDVLLGRSTDVTQPGPS